MLLSALRKKGVLGINARNINYIQKYNKRRLYPLAYNKLLTKSIAKKVGINVPELYGTINLTGDLKKLPLILKDRDDFVIKPACGSGGDGILVITRTTRDGYLKVDDSIVSIEELQHHSAKALHGLYSLGAHPDQVIIERRVIFDPIFEKISYKGVPDIRIISLLGVPVMAMLRLPTKASGGRANLHQGAIGVGIDLASGRTLTAVQGNSIIDKHPDTGFEVSGVQVPYWEKLLELGAKAYDLTGLGYQGIDIVLDATLGPLVLELNARPGLNIQIANNIGLDLRLRLVEQGISKLKSVEQRVNFAKENFYIS